MEGKPLLAAISYVAATEARGETNSKIRFATPRHPTLPPSRSQRHNFIKEMTLNGARAYAWCRGGVVPRRFDSKIYEAYTSSSCLSHFIFM